MSLSYVYLNKYILAQQMEFLTVGHNCKNPQIFSKNETEEPLGVTQSSMQKILTWM